jgi:apolipoprotein N-acyltransferase
MGAWIAAGGWLAARLRTGALLVDAGLIAPAAWVLAEWLRGWVLTGFPWLSIGYGQIDGPLAGWAPVGGVYAVTLVAALFAGLLVVLAFGRPRERLVALALCSTLAAASWAVAGIGWTQPDSEPLQVSLVQGAVPQLLKWRPEERRATMALYRDMTERLEGQDLVVWPEAAIPAPDEAVGDYLAELRRLAQRLDTQLLVGILTADRHTGEYRNSLLALGEPAGAYHKRHLVPFGEFFPVPDFIRRWMRMMNLPYSDLAPGSRRQQPLEARGVSIAPTICYEDAYGAEQLGFLPAAGLLVNVSNDAWFGDTLAPHQHLEIARMRALETGRVLLRSTNTGITAIIGERGTLVSVAPQFRPFVLTGTAQPFTGATPYVRAGNYPVLLLCTLGLLACSALSRTRARDARAGGAAAPLAPPGRGTG